MLWNGTVLCNRQLRKSTYVPRVPLEERPTVEAVACFSCFAYALEPLFMFISYSKKNHHFRKTLGRAFQPSNFALSLLRPPAGIVKREVSSLHDHYDAPVGRDLGLYPKSTVLQGL